MKKIRLPVILVLFGVLVLYTMYLYSLRSNLVTNAVRYVPQGMSNTHNETRFVNGIRITEVQYIGVFVKSNRADIPKGIHAGM